MDIGFSNDLLSAFGQQRHADRARGWITANRLITLKN
jgi:hypothetical protein